LPDSISPALAAVSAALCVDIVPAAERLLKFFAYDHLRADLQQHSARFAQLARHIARTIPAGPERTVALRKLLEAKDAAVRAVAFSGASEAGAVPTGLYPTGETHAFRREGESTLSPQGPG
jgi:hypothetical protein